MTVPPGGRRAAGAAAEELACRYLAGLGMEIVARNVRGRRGEIDIVARDGRTLVFVEVRFREKGDFGSPEESVKVAKRRSVAAAAREYVARTSPEGWDEARFDVVAVETGEGETRFIRHFPGAFDSKGKIL